MDSISDSDSEDAGSIPAGTTQKQSEGGSESGPTHSVFLRSHPHLTLNYTRGCLQLNLTKPVMFDFEKLDVYKKSKGF